MHLAGRALSKALRTMKLTQVPNRWLSPDAYVIARRRQSGILRDRVAGTNR
jgi:hypothetical protein